MSFASNMQKVAKRLLAKYGDTIDIVIKASGVYNPNTGEVDGSTDLIQTKAYVGNFTNAELSGDNVNTFDMKIIVALNTVWVNKDDTIIFAGKELRIINIISTLAQDKMIIQTLQCRAI